MVELRKRKAPTEAAPAAAKKANSKNSASTNKKMEPSLKDSATSQTIASGSYIQLEGFGGEIETQEAAKTTLKDLVNESENGVIIFTYPKASTPGCTTQACLFRDDFTSLTATGYSIYGLSRDSPKSNSNFKSKQKLPYTLLCDPAASLIDAIGMKKAPSGTVRGVIVVNKEGKIEAASPGGPAATVDIVRNLIASGSKNMPANLEKPSDGKPVEKVLEIDSVENQDVEPHDEADGDKAKADVAAEVADTAQVLDNGAAA